MDVHNSRKWPVYADISVSGGRCSSSGDIWVDVHNRRMRLGYADIRASGRLGDFKTGGMTMGEAVFSQG